MKLIKAYDEPDFARRFRNTLGGLATYCGMTNIPEMTLWKPWLPAVDLQVSTIWSF